MPNKLWLKKKGKLPHGFKTKANNLALRYREELSLRPHDSLSAFDLAKHFGVRIISPYETGLSIEEAQVVMKSGKSGWSALTMLNETGDKIVIHNICHSPARQQSNLMHELAHIICEHPMPEIGCFEGIPLPIRSYPNEHEEEAKWLGGNLQITREGLIWAIKNNMSEPEIAKYYTASIDMIRFRINMTGVNKQLRYLTRS